jgi:tRNA 2-thiouridine synthesizing protein A
MSHNQAHNIVVDARGKLCPWPLLMTKQCLLGQGVGSVVCVLADDPLAELDLRAFCLRAGHQLLELKVSETGQITARIQKAAA